MRGRYKDKSIHAMPHRRFHHDARAVHVDRTRPLSVCFGAKTGVRHAGQVNDRVAAEGKSIGNLRGPHVANLVLHALNSRRRRSVR